MVACELRNITLIAVTDIPRTPAIFRNSALRYWAKIVPLGAQHDIRRTGPALATSFRVADRLGKTGLHYVGKKCGCECEDQEEARNFGCFTHCYSSFFSMHTMQGSDRLPHRSYRPARLRRILASIYLMQI